MSALAIAAGASLVARPPAGAAPPPQPTGTYTFAELLAEELAAADSG
ncbi:hypothetical protein [Nocardia carnea]|nr:hypothetical protein [Nocardia carnea]